VFPNLTVQENLTLGAFARTDKAGIEADRKRVFELFPRLREREKQKAGTQSGGEQQMLAVGRALMSRPKLLMMDEPSLGLAPLVAKMIFDIIREINSTGVTVLLVEQNAKAALEEADYAYVLETGRITTGRGRTPGGRPGAQGLPGEAEVGSGNASVRAGLLGTEQRLRAPAPPLPPPLSHPSSTMFSCIQSPFPRGAPCP
jgi:energy-coupling factor transporter ATP-binding protein EcfA2